MTREEFYSKLMQDVQYIFKTGFKLSPEMFMQTMSYASEQYELLNKRIAELEAPKTCLQCIHHTFETEHYGLCHRNGNPEDTAYYWTCGGYEPKEKNND